MRTPVYQHSYGLRLLGVLTMTIAGTLVLGQAALAQGDLTMLDESAEGAVAISGTLTVVEPSTLDVRIAFDYQDDSNCHMLHLTPSEVSLQHIVGGDAVNIGRCRPPGQLEASQELALTVRRGSWRIAFVLGSEVLVQAFDSSLYGGTVGYSVVGAELDDAIVQPLGDVYLTDDFMRDESAQSTWEAVQGTWKTQALRVDNQSDRMEVDKSANAFSYWGKGAEGALTITGYWFWSNYSLRAAVRATGTDAVGLIAYYQDPEDYLLARWTSALAESADADQLQLVGVVGGEPTVIAEAPGGHLPEQWYSLKLSICDDLVQCSIDDELKISTRIELFGQGQPGLYCEGDEGTFFDSVAVQDWEVLSDTFEPAIPGKWVALSGSWADGEDGRMGSSGGGERVCVSGRAD